MKRSSYRRHDSLQYEAEAKSLEDSTLCWNPAAKVIITKHMDPS